MDYITLNYLLLIVSFIIVTIAQIGIRVSYKKYSDENAKSGKSGAEIAREILDKHGLSNVYVVETSGYMTDHYDPQRKVIRLSKSNYNDSSVCAISVAAHECGHAIQDKENYTFMKIRSMIYPVVNLCSKLGYIVLFIGIITQFFDLIQLGIVLESAILVFQFVTLPVEIDASKRALEEIENANHLQSDEIVGGRKVLRAAAFTYVASLAASLMDIIRLALIYGRRRN